MKQFCFIILVVALLAFPSNVRADAAPPYYPPGSNPQPGTEITQVRMEAETVVIEVLKDTEKRSLGQAHVTADFSMRNLGAADESMAARFPISAHDGRTGYPEIHNLKIEVDGDPLTYRRAMYPDIGREGSNETVPWAEFDVTFPAGEEVSLHVEYDLQGTGYYPCTTFYYILNTGAGWKGTIGSADIILRLPYEANAQNVILDIGVGWADTTTGGMFQGNEVRWHYEDFEPGGDGHVQNMEFVLVSPVSWQNVLAARAKVEKYPNDSETWGMLAKAYKEVFLGIKYTRFDAGGEELWELGVEAYEKCLSLSPNDAQWHAGFAELLAQRAYWDSWVTDEWSNPTPETFRALEEIHTALELAPDDPVVKDIAWGITNFIREGIVQDGDRYDFPWLTQTPTAHPPEPTDVPVSTPTTQDVVSVAESTNTPSPTDTPQTEPTQVTPTSVPQRSSPLCGSAAFLPLVIMLWFTTRKKQ